MLFRSSATDGVDFQLAAHCVDALVDLVHSVASGDAAAVKGVDVAWPAGVGKGLPVLDAQPLLRHAAAKLDPDAMRSAISLSVIIGRS